MIYLCLPRLRTATTLIAIALCLSTAACSTTVYKADVASFNNGVETAATAFDALSAKALERYKNAELSALAARREIVTVSAGCMLSVVGNGQLVRDSNCLADWANYRATPEGKRGAQPACLGATDSLKSGEYEYYDFAPSAAKEAVACRLVIRQPNGDLSADALDNSDVLLVNAPKLIPALKGYAAGLVGIADAADRTALTTSVGKAKDQLVKLGKQVDSLDGRTSPYVATIGPIADLVGTSLIYILEAKRHQAMKTVTSSADPVIVKAALILSNVAMPMTTMELQDLGLAYFDALPDPKLSTESDEAWLKSYGAARAARQRYIAAFDSNLSLVFKAMAQAHHELTLALADPSRQYETVAAAIEDFSDKAKATSEALEKARKETTKAKATP